MTSTSESVRKVSTRTFRLDLRREDEWWVCKQDFFNVEARGYDRDSVVNDAKGIVLCAVGSWEEMPDEVAFEVVEHDLWRHPEP